MTLSQNRMRLHNSRPLRVDEDKDGCLSAEITAASGGILVSTLPDNTIEENLRLLPETQPLVPSDRARTSSSGGWQTPYQQLENFIDSGCLSFLAYILEDGKDWFATKLDPSKQAGFEEMKAKIRSYQDIDAEHGVGASINLDHQLLMRTLRRNRGGLQRYAKCFENAERYRKLQPSSLEFVAS